MASFDCEFVLKKISELLRKSLPAEEMAQFEATFSLQKIKGDRFVFGYSQALFYQRFTERYQRELYTAVCTVSGRLARLSFVFVPDKTAPRFSSGVTLPADRFSCPSAVPDRSADNTASNRPGFPAVSTTAGGAPDYGEKSASAPFGANREETTPAAFAAVPAQPANRVTPKSARRFRRGIRQVLASLLCLVLALLLALVGVNYLVNLNFKENFYSLSLPHTYDNFRILQLSDLHNSSYGKDNEHLVSRVKALRPDLIVLTGDCLSDGESAEPVLSLCRQLAAVASTYYIYGNNECRLAFDCAMTKEALDRKFSFTDETRNPAALISADNGLKAQLEKTGVTVLLNDTASLTVRSNRILLFGTLTSNPSAFWPYAGKAFQAFLDADSEDTVKLFLCHEPLLLETLKDENFGDLALCGDTHGGVIRLPVLGALYSRNFGLFPERDAHFIYGKYRENDTQIIVSSGLTNRGPVRIGNSPELVIVDVNKY